MRMGVSMSASVFMCLYVRACVACCQALKFLAYRRIFAADPAMDKCTQVVQRRADRYHGLVEGTLKALRSHKFLVAVEQVPNPNPNLSPNPNPNLNLNPNPTPRPNTNTNTNF